MVTLLLSHLVPIPFFLMLFVQAIPDIAGWSFFGFFLLSLILLIIPLPGRRYPSPSLSRHADERDTMFSRNEIKPGTGRYDDYYSRNPEKLEKDLRFRSKPGLLSSKSSYYDPYSFASADASFEAVSAFFPFREDKRQVEQDKRQKDNDKSDGKEGDEQLTQFLKGWGRKLGAIDVGITAMKPYHFYTIGGRRERYGKDIENNHPYGIAFIVEMDYELTGTAPQGGIVMESAHQYLNSGMIATQIALTLRNLGYSAKTHIDGNYDLICPVVAKDAGLGEIGRMGLLMTPGLGPRVRISVVTTDAPLVPGISKQDDTVIDFCSSCKKCAAVCPSASIPYDDRTEQAGGLRWKIDQESCFTYWCQVGTDCGRCMAACPYSHPDNAFHRIVRRGISNNFIFRRLAIKLDDLFYGRKPAPKKMPGWLG